MGGFLTGGASVYVGITGSGKTTLAQKHLLMDSRVSRFQRVIMDLEGARDWMHYPHAPSADHVLTSLYVNRQKGAPLRTIIWTPKDERERAKFFMAVGYWGGVCVMVDGVPMIADGHNFEEEFRKALYKHRHGRIGPTFWYLVGQRMSLIHRHVFAACKSVYVFRQAPGVDAKRAYEEFGIPVERSTSLKRGEPVPVLLSFPTEGDEATRSDPGSGTPPSSAGEQDPPKDEKPGDP